MSVGPWPLARLLSPPAEYARIARTDNKVPGRITESEQLRIDITRQLVPSYFNLVRRNLVDGIPKGIMLCLVNEVKEQSTSTETIPKTITLPCILFYICFVRARLGRLRVDLCLPVWSVGRRKHCVCFVRCVALWFWSWILSSRVVALPCSVQGALLDVLYKRDESGNMSVENLLEEDADFTRQKKRCQEFLHLVSHATH